MPCLKRPSPLLVYGRSWLLGCKLLMEDIYYKGVEQVYSNPWEGWGQKERV